MDTVASPSAPTYNILGARTLHPNDVAMINRVKEQGEVLAKLVEEVRLHQLTRFSTLDPSKATHAERQEAMRVVKEGQRLRMQAIDEIQDGMRKLVYSIACPPTFA
jgi:hypothetical protein